MSEDSKKFYYFVTACGLFGMSFQLYINFKYRESVEYIKKWIQVNPTESDFNPNPRSRTYMNFWLNFFFGSTQFLYLNGPLEPRYQSKCEDRELGFFYDCVTMIRKVEKLQWYFQDFKYLKIWSVLPIDSSSYPMEKQNGPWVLTPEYFRPKRFCTLNTQKIRIKDLQGVMSYKAAWLQEDEDRSILADHPEGKIIINEKNEFSKTLNSILKDQLLYTKVDSRHFYLNTNDLGNYRISYIVAPFGQRISLIGKMNQDVVVPFCEVFAQQGDVLPGDLVGRIDVSLKKPVFLSFFCTFLIGSYMSLS